MGLQPLVAQHVEHRQARSAQETGLPPKVLKYSIPVSNERAIAGVVTTAPSGWPLPIGLPSVTMSGTTPWVSKAQKCVADPAEADLHLVGDAHRAGLADVRRRPPRGSRRAARSGRRSPAADSATNAAGAGRSLDGVELARTSSA